MSVSYAIRDEADPPRNTCTHFFLEKGLAADAVLKEDFDRLCEEGAFVEGPFVETFGDKAPEPYNPFRQAFGVLSDGRGVYCELHPSLTSI